MMTYKEKINDLNELTISILFFLNSGSYQQEVSITPVSVFSPWCPIFHWQVGDFCLKLSFITLPRFYMIGLVTSPDIQHASSHSNSVFTILFQSHFCSVSTTLIDLMDYVVSRNTMSSMLLSLLSSSSKNERARLDTNMVEMVRIG